MKLLGEEVNTEVAVLAGLGGSGDADDLAWSSLEDEQVADADVVAGDGDGVGRSHGVAFGGVVNGLDVGVRTSSVHTRAFLVTFEVTGAVLGAATRDLDVFFLDYDFLAVVVVVMMIVV